MGHYEHKTKEELLEIVCKLEKKVEGLSSELDSLKKGRFRERYSTRILDALPDMLTVFDHNANIVELASSPTTNHVEGTTSDSIINSKKRMKVFVTTWIKSSIPVRVRQLNIH